MAFRSASVASAAELIALHQRYPGDTIGGVAGTMRDGVLAQLGASSTSVQFEVPSGGSHLLTVFDGAPESGSGWESGPGIDLAGEARPAPGTGTVPPRPPPAGVPQRSSTPLVLLAIAAVAALVIFGGKS